MTYGECEKCGYSKFGNDAHDCVENLKREAENARAKLAALRVIFDDQCMVGPVDDTYYAVPAGLIEKAREILGE